MNRSSLLGIIVRKAILSVLIIFGLSVIVFTITAATPISYRVVNFPYVGEARDYSDQLYLEHGFYSGYFDENNESISIFERYLRWLGLIERPIQFEYNEDFEPVYRRSGLLQGDLGSSWYFVFDGPRGQPVTMVISERIAPTLTFLITSLTLSFLSSASFHSLFVKIRQRPKGKFIEKPMKFLDTIPNIWLLLLLVLIIIKLFIPETTPYPIYSCLVNPILLNTKFLKQFFLSLAVMVLWSTGFITRQMRVNSIELFTKRALYKEKESKNLVSKVGVDESLHTTLYNVLKLFSKNIFYLLCGAYFIEPLFSLMGITSFIVNWPKQAFDFPTMTAMVFVFLIIAILSKFVLDLLVGLLDPNRISYITARTSKRKNIGKPIPSKIHI